MNRILFNYGMIDITPDEPVILGGFANRVGLSAEIHRRLSSRCLVIKNGQSLFCLVVNDLMDVNPDIIKTITSRISVETGIPAESILITSIHTHSAPMMEYGWSDANDRYIRSVINKIVSNVVRILTDKSEIRPGIVSLGKAACGINIARRDIKPEDGGMAYRIGDPFGLKDEEVLIMEIADVEGNKKVTLFNYACHPVTLGYESNYISTDYPGMAREVIEKKRGGMAVFLNGAAGDLNPREAHNTDPQITDREGEKLGIAVVSASLEKMEGDCSLVIISDTIEIPFRDQNITKEHIENEMKRKSSDITEFYGWQDMLARWGKKVFEMLERKEVKNSFPFRVNFVKVGRAIFFFTQGELFVKYQIDLKNLFSDYMVFCVAYAHGTGAYIPTAEVFKNKGYEADQAYIYEILPSPLSPEIEKIFFKAVADNIRKLISGQK